MDSSSQQGAPSVAPPGESPAGQTDAKSAASGLCPQGSASTKTSLYVGGAAGVLLLGVSLWSALRIQRLRGERDHLRTDRDHYRQLYLQLANRREGTPAQGDERGVE